MTLKKCYLLSRTADESRFWTGGNRMKGYNTSEGYMGLVDGRYVLFASEADYREYLED